MCSYEQHRRPLLPWKTRLSVFLLGAITDASLRRDGTVNRRYFRFLDSIGFKKSSDLKPREGVITSDITVDPSRNLWFRLYIPQSQSRSQLSSQSGSQPVVVFFHGGGFVFLYPDFKVYDDVCRRFARDLPAVVVSVNYRLAPEHPYPAQYDDGFDVLKFLDDQKHILPENADISRCFLAGDSAGANLAHHVAKRACQSEFTRLKVVGVVSIQPFFGGEERSKSEIELAGIDVIVTTKRSDWMWKAFMPAADDDHNPIIIMDRDHEVINVSGPNADPNLPNLEDFPATMVVVAGFDSLKDWQTRYYEWLKKSGKEAYLVEYPNMIHGFYIFPELAESGQLISDTKHFIHTQCSKLLN
ncbi:hypothetical protein ABFS83_08G246700 [Erythranthe nasuta]